MGNACFLFLLSFTNLMNVGKGRGKKRGGGCEKKKMGGEFASQFLQSLHFHPRYSASPFPNPFTFIHSPFSLFFTCVSIRRASTAASIRAVL